MRVDGSYPGGETLPAAVAGLKALARNLVFGEGRWAKRRRLAALAFVLGVFLIGSLLFEMPATAETARRWEEQHFFLLFFPRFILQIFAIFVSGHTLRYLLPPITALLTATLLAAAYLQDIYQLPRYHMALRYLLASLFGSPTPSVTILKGQVQRKPNRPNTIELVGGPGVANINPGNALVLESLEGDIRIVPEGKHAIQRFETIRDVAYLKDYQGFIEEISAFSQDGIRMLVRDVHFRYRIRFRTDAEGAPAQRSEQDPYPYAETAVLNMAANRIVGVDGVLSWQDTVQRIVRSTIVRHINQNPIDYLTAPRVQNLDPRGDLMQAFASPQLAQRLEECGAELLWVNIGYFDIPEALVDQQRLEVWRTRWLADANQMRAYGEARRAVLEELGRAEAQAEVLMSITQALKDIGTSPDHRQNLRKLILMRTAQILEDMAEPENPPAK